MTKKEKNIKDVLIIIGMLSVLCLLVICLKDSSSLSDPVYFFIMLYLQIVMHPWLLLGVTLLFVGIAMPFKKNQKEKQELSIEEKKGKKELSIEAKKGKTIWITLLIVGIIILSIPFMTGVSDAISGTTGMCMFDCTPVYGFSAFWETFLLLSILYIPGYIIGIILIILSVIKLKKKKK